MTGQVEGLVSVVIVTYHSAGTIGRCIRSVLASTSDVEVIVVDNASADATIKCLDEVMAEWSPLQMIGNADNRGFGAACNQGALLANGDRILFLNPDAFAGPDSIARLSAHLDADRGIALIGCRVVDEQGRPHGPQRRREPTWRRSLMSATGLAKWERRWPALQGVEVAASAASPGHASTVIEGVDAVNGAAMMVRHEAFDAIDGFDERFRLHAEDLDLCRRLRDLGSRVVIANDVEVVHVGGVSSRRRPAWVEWQKARSLWRYFRKHEPATGMLVRSVMATGLAVLFLARLTLLGVRTALRR